MHFSDESKFNSVGSDSRQFVQRLTGDRLNPKCVNKSVKFGGGSVMVCGKFSSEGFGLLLRMSGNANAKVYRIILDKQVIASIRASPNQPAI